MSLAVVIHYGEGFEEGQVDMKNRQFDLWEAKAQIVEAESITKTEITEAFWMGYVDGGMSYLDGVIL